MSQSFKPWPSCVWGDDDLNPLDLQDQDLNDIAAVLKALAKGTYPRLDALPTALNVYNCNRKLGDENKDLPWAFFHPITVIPPAKPGTSDSLPTYPVIQLDVNILEDLNKRWQPIRYGKENDSNNSSQLSDAVSGPLGRFRFLCFIHKHRIDRKNNPQKGVHTISIWDREWDELTWHDTYHVDREARRKDIKQFWKHTWSSGFFNGTYSQEEFMGRIRYRTVYHICEHIEDTLRGAVPPRHTIYAVMSVALFHMNNARDPQVSIVPDRLELFGGQYKGLLPRFFAHTLWLCLDAQPQWNRGRQVLFVKQFRIVERLRWMRLRAREYLELYQRDSDHRDGVDSEDEVGRKWMYDVLNM
ncbi:uncharacterized protein F4812DRAFT_465087 [Daldinia caldariorum]|uniref:uncharacterized protein n=1 Tax=Daldinia caldariorum TaxID=326644 RepID=UPI0020076E26|nr:uncharacterized protein F4812DRAFT_465087 [Daldinia caldariorum]KAI1473187.1 hypothetical protein F4812DRAFT_465087 [Daldinia caldariorum]